MGEEKLVAIDTVLRHEQPPGEAVFEAIRREWKCTRLRVADRGLREGILMQLMRADGYLRGGRRPDAGVRAQ